ncbi:hypothetical protein OPQ81_002093 [Rhizoctonia solani]|nr:hypothetical protein OPQ81_002093 [Rhizoctonia solani]
MPSSGREIETDRRSYLLHPSSARRLDLTPPPPAPLKKLQPIASNPPEQSLPFVHDSAVKSGLEGDSQLITFSSRIIRRSPPPAFRHADAFSGKAGVNMEGVGISQL